MIPSYHLLAPRLRLITWHRVSNPLAHLRSRLSSRASLLGLGTTLECLWTPARGRARRGPGRLRFGVGESSRDEMRSRRRDRACPRSGFFPGPSADKQHREQGEKQHLLCSTPFPWAATSSVIIGNAEDTVVKCDSCAISASAGSSPCLWTNGHRLLSASEGIPGSTRPSREGGQEHMCCTTQQGHLSPALTAPGRPSADAGWAGHL